MEAIHFQYVKTNGVRLHTVTAGPEDGKLVILLHGFPDFWFGWRKQILVLAAAGYKVVVPDQRGYHLSEKPTGVRPYRLNQLKDDVIGLIQHFKRDGATVIGHDWGGAVGWHLASTCPHVVKHLIVINIPHPAVMPKGLAANPIQWLRSAYMFFFQLPQFPEQTLGNKNFTRLAQALQRTSRHGTFSTDELVKYKIAWKQPGALTSMLNWYRAIPRSMTDIGKVHSVDVPTKIIWGVGDVFLSKRLAKKSLQLTKMGSGVWIGEATHWVHQEQPSLVNEQILKFIQS
ncbi:pimeloyl-ACP methyl ester carboxylesterase [Geomicrobium halophilum]|uniref:Pimeloyl-ACP methyl ester carboxylesterase n=1 Tax=Geomicrobium halophilum TaxID=549000 RepID=A0A841Q2J0_9BACL|nr:alpha/beta hydrolase [Geomicrobium halophilum]MBB6450668.1 pimeloyl-ACP methyl ester carboxylesterase [Geomicrobium halophilum]